MRQAVDLLTAYPTVIFTAALLFFLAWWIVGMAVGGLESGQGEGHPSMRSSRVPGRVRAGHGRARHGRAARYRGGRLRRGGRREGRLLVAEVPSSVAALVTSFGSWAVSLLGSTLLEALDLTSVAKALVGTALFVVALIGGFVLLRGFASVAAPLFNDRLAPSKHAAVGSLCRVRVPPTDSRLGDATVLSGDAVQSIIRVESDAPFAKGDVALVYGYDADRDVFAITEADPILHPDGAR